MQVATQEVWEIDLLGGLRVQHGTKTVARFETRRAATLLARLALYPHRSHPREELMEMLWPDEEIEVTRLRFRQVLTTLRRTLESLGNSVDQLLIADRSMVQLSVDVISTDVHRFENSLRQAVKTDDASGRLQRLLSAIEAYGGELLPGFYEDWVLTERQRLQDEYVAGLGRLAQTLAELGEFESALNYAEKAIATDPLREESHCDLMRVYAAAGRTPDALRQYRELEQILWKEFRILPTASTQALAESLRTHTDPGSFLSAPAQRPGHQTETPPAAETAQTSPLQQESLLEPIEVALPTSLTRFFGRENEIDQLLALLPADGAAPYPLITLSGPGGTGKTRLSLEIARQLRTAFHNAVWFVPLATVTDSQSVLTAIANTVAPQGAEAGVTLNRIVHQIGHRPALLVLDNFEQVAEGSETIVTSLLERLPSLRCLVTSRRLLNIQGEQEFILAPLPVPDPREVLHPTPLLADESPSVQLFVDRVQKGKLGFGLTADNREVVLDLCRRLEGIPLAIELAAAWATALSPQQLLDRLSRRFELLVSRRKDMPERHLSLRATVEWSYEQLAPPLQRLFLQLSVFRGGWTLDAAEAITKDEGGRMKDESSQIHPFGVLDILDELRSHSLILSENVGTEMRFRMLETLREFAEETLTEAERQDLRKRHAHYVLELAERAEAHLASLDQIPWLELLHLEYDNIREALRWSISAEGEVEVALRIVAGISRYWSIRLNQAEVDHWLDILMPRVDETSPLIQARFLEAAGRLVAHQPTYDQAFDRTNQSLALYRSLNDESGIARVLYLQGIMHGFTGNPEQAHSLLTQSIALLEQQQDSHTLAMALGAQGTAARLTGDYATAGPLLQRAVAMHRIAGSKYGMAWCLFSLARTASEQEDYTTALPLFEDTLALFRQLNHRQYIMHTLYNIGDIHQATGNLAGAQKACEEALRIALTLEDPYFEATYLVWSGDLASQNRNFVTAQAFYRRALLLSRDAHLQYAYRPVFQRFAYLAAAQDDAVRAVRLFAAGSVQEPDRSLDIPNSLPLSIQTDPDRLRAEVGETAFLADWQSGERMTLELAISYALYEG